MFANWEMFADCWETKFVSREIGLVWFADELLVDFWLRVSRPMAEALHQEFEVLSERDAPADNISPLLDAVAGVARKREAPDAVGAAPGAKRARDAAVAPA